MGEKAGQGQEGWAGAGRLDRGTKAGLLQKNPPNQASRTSWHIGARASGELQLTVTETDKDASMAQFPSL